MELLAKKLLFETLTLGIYFETDEEEVTDTVNRLSKELESLDKDSILYNYLLDSVADQQVNEEVWKQFFRE